MKELLQLHILCHFQWMWVAFEPIFDRTSNQSLLPKENHTEVMTLPPTTTTTTILCSNQLPCAVKLRSNTTAGMARPSIRKLELTQNICRPLPSVNMYTDDWNRNWVESVVSIESKYYGNETSGRLRIKWNFTIILNCNSCYFRED